MSSSRTVYTAHDPSDLVNVLPAAFGFVPQESLCVIATSGPRHRMGFRMRLDLDERVPPEEVVRIVCHHLTRQRAEGAMIIAVSARPEVAERYVWAVERGLGTVKPVVSVWATDERYWTTFDGCDPDGYPYERTLQHLAVVQAVAEGQEILGSRDELRTRIAPIAGERRRWFESAADEHNTQISALLMRSAPGEVVGLARHDVGGLLDRAEEGEVLTDGEVLRVSTWTALIPVRDDFIGRIDVANAPASRALWERASRITVPALRPAALCLAGLAAHRCGEGAAAVVAAEAAVRETPDYSLGVLLLQILEAGISPDELSSVWRGEHRHAV